MLWDGIKFIGMECDPQVTKVKRETILKCNK